MTIFIALLITGFFVLLANRVLLYPFRKKIGKIRALLLILGAVMYTVGAVGQIGVYMGATTGQSFAMAATAVFAFFLIAINFFIKTLGLDHKDEDLISQSGIVKGAWKDNKGTVEIEIDGRVIIRIGTSDQDYADGDKVVIVSVDEKTGSVEVAPALHSRKISAKA